MTLKIGPAHHHSEQTLRLRPGQEKIHRKDFNSISQLRILVYNNNVKGREHINILDRTSKYFTYC